MWKALYAYQDITEKQFQANEELDLADWFQHRIFVQRIHEECMKAVDSLPSADAVQGEWELIETYADGYDFMGDRTWAHKYKCPYCGFINTVIENFGQYDFCPNCGARMKGGDSE